MPKFLKDDDEVLFEQVTPLARRSIRILLAMESPRSLNALMLN